MIKVKTLIHEVRTVNGETSERFGHSESIEHSTYAGNSYKMEYIETLLGVNGEEIVNNIFHELTIKRIHDESELNEIEPFESVKIESEEKTLFLIRETIREKEIDRHEPDCEPMEQFIQEKLTDNGVAWLREKFGFVKSVCVRTELWKNRIDDISNEHEYIRTIERTAQ